MMGDIQQYFVDNAVRNFYSVSISGYHIAEAVANLFSLFSFILSNGFTSVEYYLARGMKIDDLITRHAQQAQAEAVVAVGQRASVFGALVSFYLRFDLVVGGIPA